MGWPEPDRKRGRSPRATPLRRRLRHAGGPRGIGGWLKLLAGGTLLAVVFTTLAVIFTIPAGFLLPSQLPGLVGITLATVAAGKWAGIRGAGWWIASWLMILATTIVVSFEGLMFFASQV